MPVRLKIRRHGERAGGKVVLKPDTWEGLLSRCSAKLTREGEPPFVACRLFVADGFEVEALDEIAADDVLVVTAGEDYNPLAGPSAAGAEPSRQPSMASVGSSASDLHAAAHQRNEVPGSLASAREAGSEGDRLIGSLGSFAADLAGCTDSGSADADPRPAATSPPLSGVGSGGESAPGGLDLVVIQASPLTLVHMGRVHPLPQLNALMERERLSEILSRSRRRIQIAFETATTDNVRAVLTLGARALHYSGHGEESCLAFEDGVGSTHQITPPLLASTCIAGRAAPGDSPAVAPALQLVFVCACHSQPAANAFVRAGVPHVVAVRSTGQVLDQVSRSSHPALHRLFTARQPMFTAGQPYSWAATRQAGRPLPPLTSISTPQRFLFAALPGAAPRLAPPALLPFQVAICFTRHFYLSLFSGQSVAQAFEVAQAAVRAMPASKVKCPAAAAYPHPPGGRLVPAPPASNRVVLLPCSKYPALSTSATPGLPSIVPSCPPSRYTPRRCTHPPLPAASLTSSSSSPPTPITRKSSSRRFRTDNCATPRGRSATRICPRSPSYLWGGRPSYSEHWGLGVGELKPPSRSPSFLWAGRPSYSEHWGL
jgi:hypothetical protein